MDEDVTPLDEDDEDDCAEAVDWEREKDEDDSDEDSEEDENEAVAQTPDIAKTPIVGNVLRSPLIRKEDAVKGSPLGTTVSESLTESIRKEQLVFRELILKATASSPAAASSTSTSTILPTISIKDIGKPPGIKMSKSQKKKSKKTKTKQNLITVLMESSSGDSIDIQPPKIFHEMEVQTDTTLPHTQRNIIWTPNGMKTVVDIDAEDEDGSEQGEDADDSAVQEDVVERFTAYCKQSITECVSDVNTVDFIELGGLSNVGFGVTKSYTNVIDIKKYKLQYPVGI